MADMFLKLNKLLYCSYLWRWIVKNEQLFDQPIEAWEQGPLVSSKWIRFIDYQTKPLEFSWFGELSNIASKEVRQYLEKIWLIYGQFTAEVSSERETKEKPWQRAHEKINEDQVVKGFYRLLETRLMLQPCETVKKGPDGWKMDALEDEDMQDLYRRLVTDDK